MEVCFVNEGLPGTLSPGTGGFCLIPGEKKSKFVNNSHFEQTKTIQWFQINIYIVKHVVCEVTWCDVRCGSLQNRFI